MPRHKHNGEISSFSNYFEAAPVGTSDIMNFLKAIKSGKWKEEVIKARERFTAGGKEDSIYKSIKKSLPCATISGTFDPERKEDMLIAHSGFICMDFDSLPDVDLLKDELKSDEYTFAVFKSISGQGLAVIVKIGKPERHRDYFALLREHYRERYQVEADKQCINVSRLRGASYDADMFINTDSSVWAKVTGLKKVNKPKPVANVIATKSDFADLINEITSKGVDITDGYENWLSCGFALAEEFGDSGREYFHAISSMSVDYDQEKCDKQYTHCINSDNGSKITIGTFYYFCKNQGLEVSSKLTREAVNIVSVKRAANFKKEEALEAVAHLKIDPEDLEHIVEQVYNSPINRQFVEDLPLAERVELYLINTYDIRINELGDFVEIDGKPMDARKPNQLWIECMKFVDEKTPQHLVRASLDSEKIPTYNPLKQFFIDNEANDTTGHINAIADSIPSVTTVGDMTSKEYKRKFLTKWLVGMIGGIYGEANPLVLALCGAKTNTGKTEFFRRLLPEELRRFQDEATLDNSNDRDNIIKLVKNMLIFDDEGASRNYKEAQKFKALTSKSRIKIRKLHTSIESEYQRIATLGITSNETDVIKEETNRRIIPIEVTDEIDYKALNAVDRKAMIMEAYHLYKSGYVYLIGRDDIEDYNKSLSSHMEQDPAVNAIKECISAGLEPVPSVLAMEYISRRFQFMKSGSMLFGKKMKIAGFDRVQRRDMQSKRVWCYLVDQNTINEIKTYLGISMNEYGTFQAETGKLF